MYCHTSYCQANYFYSIAQKVLIKFNKGVKIISLTFRFDKGGDRGWGLKRQISRMC